MYNYDLLIIGCKKLIIIFKKSKVMAWQLHDVEVIIDANKCNSILYHAWEGHEKVTNNIFCKHQNMDTGNKVDKR